MSYKPLAPRPAYGHPYPDPTSPPNSKRKPAPKTACETCRTRKTACDGKRPSCSKCTRKLLPCRYSTTGERLKERVRELQSSLDRHVELVNFLSATPEGKIIQVLRDLRAAPGPMDYLAIAKSEVDTPQGSRSPTTDTGVAGSLQSLSRVDLEFDRLTARYQITYPVLPPIPLATVHPHPRFPVPVLKPGPGQPPLVNVGGSISAHSTSLLQGQSSSTDPLDSLTAALTERLRPSHRTTGASSRRLATPPPYIDERLSRLQIDYWTSVPISNDFAATVISTYLEVDHPFYAFFDDDLFLSDLVSLEVTFCSPFLVSSLLSHACYTCAAIDSRTSALGHAFFQEAEMLYRAERMSDLLPSSSALAIFSMVCTLQCRDDLALETQQLSRQMGERMKLFGVPEEEGNRVHFNNMTPHMKIASAQVAWGLYSWLRCFTDGVLRGETHRVPSDLANPRCTSRQQQTRKCIQPRLARTFSPDLDGQGLPRTLHALGPRPRDRRRILDQSREAPFERVSLAFAETKYTKLLEWAATLRPELQRQEQNTPIDTLLFHMYLHTVILTLFRPFLQSPLRDQKLRVFNSADSSPGAIYEVSINQMKHMVFQHHLDFPDKLFSSFAYAGYMQLGSAIASAGPSVLGSSSNRSTQDRRREQRFYFDLCMCFFQDAYLQHTVARPVAQGLLCMALENRLLRASKVRQVLEQFRKREEHQNHAGYQSRISTTPPQAIVNFELAVVDVDAARAHRLASKLEDLLLFDEFTSTTTTGEDEDDCSYNGDGNYENESDNEQDYESSAQSGSVLGSDLYRTPTSDVSTDVNNCWMDGCDWS
ncbi:uncharacterized protein PG986_014508 [Apiospora aurea]|uniref:Zn(2)-C6 fungal-type domain-containing protein n=1 Tax=Apiospora aurea TaxID=335848 RepID=A0ABR1PT65_9PEZI